MSFVPECPGVFRQSFPLAYPDADASGLVRATSVLNCLQVVAGDHTTACGFDYRVHRDQEIFWVLSRLSVQFDRWPEWPCVVDVDTWARSTKAVFALRDFRFGVDDSWVGRASSAWVLLKERKPQRPEPWVEIYERTRPEAPVAEMPAALPAWEESSRSATRRVRASWEDVDMNGHVNNVRGIGWCLGQHEQDFLLRHRPLRLDANFLAEMFCGQEYDVLWTEQTDGSFDYLVRRADDGPATLRVRIAFGDVPPRA